MREWTKRPNGTWKITGKTKTRRVHIQALRDGLWSQAMAPYSRADAEKIVADAVASGQTGKTEAYRLLPHTEAEVSQKKGRYSGNAE